MDPDCKVLTVFVNFRTADLTLRAVEALMTATGEMPSVRAVVVDNGSGDGSLETLRRGVARASWYDRVDVLDAGRNAGFGAGCNVGIRFGLSLPEVPDLFYMLNSDAFADEHTVPELVRFMRSRPHAGIAGSVCWGEDTGDRSTAFRFPSLASELISAVDAGPLTRLLDRYRVGMPLPREPVRCDWVTGAGLMVRREVIERIGMFDEGYFLYFEETDLCRRASQAGYEVWNVPSSRVMHLGGASTGTRMARYTPHWFRSRHRYFVKHHGRLYSVGADGARVVGYLIHHLHKRVMGRAPSVPPHFLRDLLVQRERAPR